MKFRFKYFLQDTVKYYICCYNKFSYRKEKKKHHFQTAEVVLLSVLLTEPIAKVIPGLCRGGMGGLSFVFLEAQRLKILGHGPG